MSFIDCVHVCNTFLVSNNKNISKVKETQDQKLRVNDLYSSGSKAGALYGLAKIRKALEDRTPSFRPILSAIGTPTYTVIWLNFATDH